MITAYNPGNQPHFHVVGVSELPFVEGMEVFSDTPVTKTGPDAGTLEFVGSQPDGKGITTWGNAQWEVTDSVWSSAMVDVKAIPTPALTTQTLEPSDRSNINLQDDTTYKVRLKYTSSDPDVESVYSDEVNFKTASTTTITSRLNASTTIFYDKINHEVINDQELVLRFGLDPQTADLSQLGIAELTEQPDYPVAGYVKAGEKYKPIENPTARIEALLTRLAVLEAATGAGAQAIDGYYPLYSTEAAANAAGDGTSHSHTFDGVTYYMPNGVTFYHGDYSG